MSEQETTYTVYCVSDEGKIKTISDLKSQEEINRVAHHEIDTGKWRLVFSLDDKEGESYYSPAAEITRLQSRVERLEEALRFYADLNNYRKDDLGYTKVGFDLGDIARSALELEREDSE